MMALGAVGRAVNAGVRTFADTAVADVADMDEAEAGGGSRLSAAEAFATTPGDAGKACSSAAKPEAANSATITAHAIADFTRCSSACLRQPSKARPSLRD
jgi:hypothetical protein